MKPHANILFHRVSREQPDSQAAEVARIESLGGKRIEIGQSADPATTWVVMADIEGNEFCVLKEK